MDATIPMNAPSVSTLDALWSLIASQPKAIRKALCERMKASEEAAKTLRQQRMVKDSLTRAMKELKAAQAEGLDKLPDARNLFK